MIQDHQVKEAWESYLRGVTSSIRAGYTPRIDSPVWGNKDFALFQTYIESLFHCLECEYQLKGWHKIQEENQSPECLTHRKRMSLLNWLKKILIINGQPTLQLSAEEIFSCQLMATRFAVTDTPQDLPNSTQLCQTGIKATTIRLQKQMAILHERLSPFFNEIYKVAMTSQTIVNWFVDSLSI